MTNKIEFAEGLSLPVDAATQTIGFIARKRGGKSYGAGKIVEGFHKHGVQFVVLSPLPNWYGLRLAADGKSPGIDVPLLGGLRGDIPLSSDSGKLIADAIIDTGRSFVLDVSQFSLGERKRFATALGEQLWHRQKMQRDPRPVHVVLEEAQLFLPQFPMPEERPMLGIWTEIVRLGGNVGIGVTLITQRPQSVAKEALTQVECLVVLQVNGVPEKKALKEWIVEKGASTDLLNELPFLPRGEAYVWSPQWLEHFGRHKILPKWTFDSGSTPKVGVKRVQADLKPIDLEGLKAQMSEATKKAEENDPGALKRRVRELEAELKKKAPAAPKEVVETVEVPAVTGAELKRLEALCEKVTALTERQTSAAAALQKELGVLAGKIMSLNNRPAYGKFAGAEKHGKFVVTSNGADKLRARLADPEFQTVVAQAREKLDRLDDVKIAAGARRMLIALASRHPTRLSEVQFRTLAGLSAGGTFDTYKSKLRTIAFIDEDSAGFGITPDGLAWLGHDRPEAPSSTEDLIRLWEQRFPSKVGLMLREVVSVFPNKLSFEELRKRVDLSEGGTFDTYLSKLRSNALVETHKNEVKASESLFI
jgi:hypothetical protein